ncbi:hypothetical protein DMENIID0001_067540 [Sergentomyia squamirostris]
MKTILVIFVVLFCMQLGLIAAAPGLTDDLLDGIGIGAVLKPVTSVKDDAVTLVTDVVEGLGGGGGFGLV